MPAQNSASPRSPQNPSFPAADAALLDRAVALVAEHPDYAPAFAALLQIDVEAPAAGVPALIASPAASLYRRGFSEFNSIAELPFYDAMAEPVDGMRSYWVEPDLGEGDDAETAQNAFGRRSAGAYFLDVQRGDDRIPFHSLLEDVFADPHRHTLARIAFCGYITRLLWLYGQQLSPAQVAADVEAVILQDEARAAEDDAILKEAR